LVKSERLIIVVVVSYILGNSPPAPVSGW